MASVDKTNKGQVLHAVAYFITFFIATMGTVGFMAAGNWLGVLGAGIGGSLGVGLVASQNKPSGRHNIDQTHSS